MEYTNKPKMYLEDLGIGDGFELIKRAGSILAAYDMKEESIAIHQEATVTGYRFYTCLKLLKKYMEI